MNRSKMWNTVLAVVAIAALAMTAGNVLADCGHCKAPMVVGNGYSTETDAKAAGAEAAEMAKKALGKEKAEVVLVFDSVGADAASKKAMLEGIASIFDARIIHGCSAYAPITQDCNTGTVGVMAIGGDVHIQTAVAPVGTGHEACGKAIGEALKAANKSDAPGQFVVLVGSCHVNKNNDLVKGVYGVLGEKYSIAGGAASKGEFVYSEGELVEGKVNLGVLISGNFTCSFAAGNGKGLEGVIESAGEACKNALGENKKKAVTVFAFDCGGRRGSLKSDVPKELAAMKDVIGDLPLFGFYGSGETGPKDNDSPPAGVGYHVIICAILAQ